MCSHDPNLPYAEPPVGHEHSGALVAPVARSPREAIRPFVEQPRRRRHKLWDIPAKYHCPIVGTCLHVEDLRRLAHKIKGALNPGASDFEVHVRFVAYAEEKHPLSIATQKLLEHKHARSIRQFAPAKDGDQLQQFWQEAVAAGRVPGAFWALMTHPKADLEVRSRAYQDVHMLSHQVGAGLVTDARLLAETRAELIKVREDAQHKAQRSRAALSQRDRRIASLEGNLANVPALERGFAKARRTIADLQSGRLLRALHERLERLETEVEDLKQSEARATSRAALWRARFKSSQETLERTAAELQEHRAANRVLEQPFPGDSGPGAGCDRCTSERCETCPDLAGRRVLCIGGRSSLACRYRSLVDRFNGEFVHHDGGREDSRQRLDSLLCAADVVVCPADCVSHDAYLKAKRYCKRTTKPCVLLKSSGVASFALALEQVAA